MKSSDEIFKLDEQSSYVIMQCHIISFQSQFNECQDCKLVIWHCKCGKLDAIRNHVINNSVVILQDEQQDGARGCSGGNC